MKFRRQVLKSSTQLQNKSFVVVNVTRASAKCRKTKNKQTKKKALQKKTCARQKNSCAKRAKRPFFILNLQHCYVRGLLYESFLVS